MYKVKLVLSLEAICHKHPKFNPSEGVAGIKANCEFCHSLLRVKEHVKKVDELFEELTGKSVVRDLKISRR